MTPIKDAIVQLKEGKFLIVIDDEDRENEGDFVIPTAMVTPEKVNFMAKEGRGLICISLPESQLGKLNIPPMTLNNNCLHGTAFCLSCEAKLGVTTGISAYDRCATMQKLIDPLSKNDDFVFPGHVFPLKTARNGVLERQGHTEASADLASLSGFFPSGVIVEIMDDDGQMAKLTKLEIISKKFGIGIVTIEDLVNYREKNNLKESLYTDWQK